MTSSQVRLTFQVNAIIQEQMKSMLGREEFESISIDATCKICLRICGQASYRAPSTVRTEAAFDDESSLRRLLTVRGRTGAVLLMQPIAVESASCVSQCLATALPAEALGQVRYVFVDDPSQALFQELRQTCPSLQLLALDPPHLAIVYEYATWRKRTPGSHLLRRIMGKLSKVSSEFSSAFWGPFFDGSECRELDYEETVMRSHVLAGSLSRARAVRILQTMDAEKPFRARIEFLEALAALSSLHPEDMVRKVTGSNKPLSRILWCACSASRLEWYFNNQRVRHIMRPSRVELMGVGTASNEALHAEINAWFRTIQVLHQATLMLKCRILTLKKQLAHCSALDHPTLKQIPSRVVLARVIANPIWTTASWRRWCSELATGGGLAQPDLPLHSERRAQVARVRKWTKKKPASGHQVKSPKRTPFSLQRKDNLIRGGVKHTSFGKGVSAKAPGKNPLLRPEAARAIMKRPALMKRPASQI